MRKFLKYAALAALLLVLPVAYFMLPGETEAQTNVYISNVGVPITIGEQRVGPDTAPALYIKYVGTEALGVAATTVAVTADTDITFLLNGAAYTGFECPIAAPLGGIILTGNAACDTLGEVVDIINGDARHQFIAWIGAGLRSDVIETTTNLVTEAADEEVMSPEGEVIYWDSSVSFDEEIPFWRVARGVQEFIQPGQTRANNASPFKNSDNVLMYGWEQFTTGGATTFATVTVYCVVEDYFNHRETVQVLYNEPLGATTVYNAFAETIDGGVHCRGGKMFARSVMGGQLVAATNTGLYGYRAPLQ